MAIELRTCTLTEAAWRMGVRRQNIFRLIDRNAIRAVNLNGEMRVILQSLVDYVANIEKVRGNYCAESEA